MSYYAIIFVVNAEKKHFGRKRRLFERFFHEVRRGEAGFCDLEYLSKKIIIKNKYSIIIEEKKYFSSYFKRRCVGEWVGGGGG